jgi:hypothetical protein
LIGTKDANQTKRLPLIIENWDLLVPLRVLNGRDFNILLFQNKHDIGK